MIRPRLRLTSGFHRTRLSRQEHSALPRHLDQLGGNKQPIIYKEGAVNVQIKKHVTTLWEVLRIQNWQTEAPLNHTPEAFPIMERNLILKGLRMIYFLLSLPPLIIWMIVAGTKYTLDPYNDMGGTYDGKLVSMAISRVPVITSGAILLALSWWNLSCSLD